jgi:hypothetical protein
VRSSTLLDQIEADIAEAERLIAELRFKITVAQSSDEDTTEMRVRLQQMLRVLLALRDQREEAGGAKPLIIASEQPTVDHSSYALAEPSSQEAVVQMNTPNRPA